MKSEIRSIGEPKAISYKKRGRLDPRTGRPGKRK